MISAESVGRTDVWRFLAFTATRPVMTEGTGDMMIMTKVGLRRRLIVPCAAIALAMAAAPAGAQTLQVNYNITLIGLKLGTATMVAKLNETAYDLAIQAKLTGLAGAFTSGKGAATATGSIAGTRVTPATFAISSQSSDDARTVRMALADSTVKAVDIDPPIEERADRVPVDESHKRGVLDPIGAMVMVVDGKVGVDDAAACNRTIPVFDGAARFNIVLSHAGSRDIDTPGYKGRVAVCKARYKPIAGHRANRPATKFMEANEDIEAWLAPVGQSRVLMPYRISIRTMIGTTVLEASRFEVDGAPASNAPIRASAGGRAR